MVKKLLLTILLAIIPFMAFAADVPINFYSRDVGGVDTPLNFYSRQGMATDPYTVLLLHGNTDFSDSSPSNHLISSSGDVQISSSQYKFGGASILFDGTGDYLTTPLNSDFNMTPFIPFTIECWIRIPSQPSINHFYTFFSLNRPSPNMGYVLLDYFNDNTAAPFGYKLQYIGNVSGAQISPLLTISLDLFHHIEVDADGTLVRLFYDGSMVGSDTQTLWNANLTTGTVNVGYWPGNANFSYMNGYIDELRISKGIARHTSDFIPPAVEYNGLSLQDIPINFYSRTQ